MTCTVTLINVGPGLLSPKHIVDLLSLQIQSHAHLDEAVSQTQQRGFAQGTFSITLKTYGQVWQ